MSFLSGYIQQPTQDSARVLDKTECAFSATHWTCHFKSVAKRARSNIISFWRTDTKGTFVQWAWVVLISSVTEYLKVYFKNSSVFYLCLWYICLLEYQNIKLCWKQLLIESLVWGSICATCYVEHVKSLLSDDYALLFQLEFYFRRPLHMQLVGSGTAHWVLEQNYYFEIPCGASGYSYQFHFLLLSPSLSFFLSPSVYFVP